MALQPAQFRKRFPEFEDAENSVLSIYLELADKCIGSNKFGNKREDAAYFLAAHMYAKITSGGATGAISSEKVGDLQTNYSNPAVKGSGAEYQTTPYGQLYWQLLRGCVITPLVSKC